MTAAPPRRPDASMTLLTEMLQRPLDPGYAAAAARRAASGTATPAASRSPALLLACVLVGLLLAVAATTLGSGTSRTATVRGDLISRIESRRTEAETTTAAIAATETQISALERAALDRAQQGSAADKVAVLRQVLGADAVTGPGLAVTLDDAPETGTPAQSPGHGRVLSRDVVFVVNALWAAGAEAIAVDGQRLSSRTAIRFAGDAILVNFRPLVPPYRIQAIGDPDTLPAAFAEGAGAAYVKSLGDNFGVVTKVDTSDDLVLPAATSLTVTTSRPLKEGS
ncbi:MAG: DUF881 domain-containing protein [Tetrasphaera sp.]|jgi:uncharacterized protein YlxW (UPF0749 family)|nr:DUF881 domain-containing protein [Tetrasphaera sp.]